MHVSKRPPAPTDAKMLASLLPGSKQWPLAPAKPKDESANGCASNSICQSHRTSQPRLLRLHRRTSTAELSTVIWSSRASITATASRAIRRRWCSVYPITPADEQRLSAQHARDDPAAAPGAVHMRRKGVFGRAEGGSHGRTLRRMQSELTVALEKGFVRCRSCPHGGAPFTLVSRRRNGGRLNERIAGAVVSRFPQLSHSLRCRNGYGSRALHRRVWGLAVGKDCCLCPPMGAGGGGVAASLPEGRMTIPMPPARPGGGSRSAARNPPSPAGSVTIPGRAGGIPAACGAPPRVARNVSIPRASRGHSAARGAPPRVATNVTIPRASRGHSGGARGAAAGSQERKHPLGERGHFGGARGAAPRVSQERSIPRRPGAFAARGGRRGVAQERKQSPPGEPGAFGGARGAAAGARNVTCPGASRGHSGARGRRRG